ncbi:UNKNOWN [Stylonychia lemnae]|uniref:Regulator of chromosome condensation 1/beta-lactamase-inhibitor protein II n=1 Tax=Stylonychia lemnae TaxID=5949 RepID=A0A077ZR61_STYLE|nr:UNKNOWN [Stylonychia lemnae]|eukprot:CDW72382.1 UNKNOWN [Stylonychia lemnae]
MVIPESFQYILKHDYPSPQKLYLSYKKALDEDLLFSFLLNKKQYLKFAAKHYTLTEEYLIKEIFSIFKVKNEAHNINVINMLEVFTALTILADFGCNGLENIASNSDQIEHKINLLILLFTFREQQSLNISEVIIMAKTCLSCMNKMYPEAEVFKNKQVQEEIKNLMIDLFLQRIEDTIRAEKTQSRQNANERQKQSQKVEPMVERAANVGLMKKYSPVSEMVPSSGFGSPFGQQQQQKKRGYDPEHQHETLEEKKDRLFKWNQYQNVKLTQEFIKEQLVENLNILRFVNLFETFNQTIMIWGSNESYQLGLLIKKDFAKFYSKDQDTQESLKKKQDLILQQILDIKARNQQQSQSSELQNHTNLPDSKESMIEIQVLLQQWQDTLMNQQTNNENFTLKISHQNYERKIFFEKPQLLMSFLNTRIIQIQANERFTLILSQSGKVYSLGHDMRLVKQDHEFGIPRLLQIKQQIVSVKLGHDHALLLDENSNLYSFGSNMYGQLGIHDKAILEYQYHPLTRKKLFYTDQPLPVKFFNEALNDIHIKQVECGEQFSIIIDQLGNIYSFGKASNGQLGIILQKGTIKNVLKDDNALYSRAIQKLETLDKNDQVDLVKVGGQHVYALTRNKNLYFWGFNQKGLNCENNSEQNYQLFNSIQDLRDSQENIRNAELQLFRYIHKSQSHDSHRKFNYIGIYTRKSICRQNLKFLIVSMAVVQMHAIHVYEESNFKSVKDIKDVLDLSQNEKVGFINDFDLPYCYTKTKFPKLKKKKKGKKNVDGDDDSDEDGEGEEEDGKDDEEEEDEEDEEGSQRSGDENEDDAQDGNQRRGDGSDDDDDEDDEGDGKKKPKKKKRKSKHNKRKSRKKRGSDDEGNESDVEKPKELSPKQVREKEVQVFVQTLNVKKAHFKEIEQKFKEMPVVCELDEEYEITLEDQVSRRPSENQGSSHALQVNPKQEQRRSSFAKPKKKETETSDEEDQPPKKVAKKSIKDKDSESESEEEEKDESSKTSKKDKKKSKKKKKGDDDSDGSDANSLDKSSKDGSDQSDDDSEDQSDGSDEDESDEDESESQEEESEEEDEYIQKEKSYNNPSEPEMKKHFNKLDCKTIFENKVLFVNFLADDCYQFLKKMVSLIELYCTQLNILIISLPQNATCIDTYYAQLLCKLCYFKGGELQIFFIKYDDKTELINKVFKREPKKFTQQSDVKIRLQYSQKTQLYAWGCADYGKLGVTNKLKDLLANRKFQQETRYIWAQKDKHSDSMDQLSGGKNLLGIYTSSPQPIVALLGVQIQDVALGMDHCLALSSDGTVYAWGDNRKNQLGIDIKTIQEMEEQDAENEAENIDTKLTQNKQEYVGVPTPIEQINGRVNFVSCGSYTSFASVDIS